MILHNFFELNFVVLFWSVFIEGPLNMTVRKKYIPWKFRFCKIWQCFLILLSSVCRKKNVCRYIWTLSVLNGLRHSISPSKISNERFIASCAISPSFSLIYSIYSLVMGNLRWERKKVTFNELGYSHRPVNSEKSNYAYHQLFPEEFTIEFSPSCISIFFFWKTVLLPKFWQLEFLNKWTLRCQFLAAFWLLPFEIWRNVSIEQTPNSWKCFSSFKKSFF